MALTEPEKPKQPALAGSAKDASRKPSFLAASLALLGLAMTAGLLLWPRHKAQSPPTLSRHTAPVAPITTADSDKHVAVSSSLPALSRGKPGEGVQAAETSRAAASSPTAQGTPSAQPAAAKPADETNAKVPKPSRDCEPMAPSTACVFTPSLTEAQRDLLLRAFQQADAKFCAGETLRLGGLPKSPQISQAPASLRKDVASVLSLTLRGLLRDVGFPGTVRIRCPRP